MKRVGVALMVVVAVTGLYLKYEPTLTYVAGQLAANLYYHGTAAGSATYRLPVPFHRQEHALSCEVASLKMALAGTGLHVPEMELVAALDYDPTPKRGGEWGDPYYGFVGEIDGKMLTTGYGVYWEPIAKLGLRYRNTEVIHNGSLQQLIYHLNQGRPVVVWGYYGRGNTVEWTTPAGKSITGVNGEHARVLIGYNGNSVNPDSVILMDPIYGEMTWSVPQFLENWGRLESAAVVVYQQPKWVKVPFNDTVWEIAQEGDLRQAMAMDWNSFLMRGGRPEAIVPVTADWLGSIPEGPVLKS